MSPVDEPQTRCSIGCPGSDLCVDCMDLKDLGHQLAEAEESARMVRAHIAAVKSRINARMDPVTRNLPIEVTCRIFELYANLDFVKAQMIAGVEPTGCETSPLTLGAVCRRWRDIAWSFPVLWTALALDLHYEPRVWSPELVRQWLERAAGQPLAIQFSNLRGSNRARSDFITIIDIVNQFSSQWKVLDLSGLPYDLLRRIDDTQYVDPTSPSQITHICVAETRHSSPDPRPGILNFSRKHRPTFLSFVSDSDPITLNIDWTNVSRIHVARSMSSFMSVLPLAATSPMLRQMTMYSLIDDYGPIWSADPPIVELTALRDLSFEGSRESSGRVFNAMTLPFLQVFHLDSNLRRFPSFPPPPMHSICHLFTRSNCPLLHLTLLNLDLYANGTLPLLLECVPSLLTLTLSYVHNPGNPGELFSALSGIKSTNNSTPFLPNLTSLVIAVHETNAWGPLADIWGISPQHLPLNGENPTPEQKPHRQNLSVRLDLRCVSGVQPEHYMDRYMLKRMVSLWETQGIVVPIGIITYSEPDRDLSGNNFYEQSYNYNCSGDWEDEALHQSLMSMLSTFT